MIFKFNVGQCLSDTAVITAGTALWLKGLHCEVCRRVTDDDTGAKYYVVREYLNTDNPPEGEIALVDAAKLEANHVPWVGYDAWNKLHNIKL